MMKPHKSNRPIRFMAHYLLPVLAMAVLSVPAQASISFSNTPICVSTSVDPNVMFILDDSGSMQWEVLPDGEISQSIYYMFPTNQELYGDGWYSTGWFNTSTGWLNTTRQGGFEDDNIHNFRRRSHHNNKTFYNPDQVYRPWVNAIGEPWPQANPECAYHNPADESLGCRNLTVVNDGPAGSETDSVGYWRRHDSSGYSWYAGPYQNAQTSEAGFWPATYFVWSPGNTGCNNNTSSRNCYTKYEIKSGETYPRHSNREDCKTSNSHCTYDEEIQNFANWYTYHRSRILTSRASIGRAFADQEESIRVGFGSLNKGNSTIDGLSTSAIISGVRPFSGTGRTEFFENLYEHPIPVANTPLRWALDRAGRYFSYDDNHGPWGANPGTNDPTPHVQCRQSYSILMTDGYWNSSAAGVSEARQNTDGTDGPRITSTDGRAFDYEARSPFTDGHSDTLADVAMYYWKNDLRSDLDNKVPTTPIDPAFWQHMVTFGVALGVTGSVDPDEAFDAINDPSHTPISWPNPTSSDTAKLDDLLHAAVNSRGGFFTTEDPEAFAEELSDVLTDIIGRATSAATSAAASSAVLQDDTLIYTAGFRPDDWSGQLAAREMRSDGSVVDLGDPNCDSCWDAEQRLRDMTPTGRNIHTSTGEFFFGNLTTGQQAALNRNPQDVEDNLGNARVRWLRGENVIESAFRSRYASGPARLLGDIVHSNPYIYNDVLYVGANDGMLHAFDIETGDELFAYIPSPLLEGTTSGTHAPLSRVMGTDYEHEYFLDGQITVSRVNNKTVLIGSMGVGGRTLFALDVTDPANFSHNDVMWEFTHADLGDKPGRPAISQLSEDGTWVVITGNGYNSAGHQASLVMIDLQTGAHLKTVSTGVGSSSSPNGLASPFVTDWPIMNLRAQRVYAGDLQGNLWRFDLSGEASSWDATLVFTAEDASGTPQPITSKPLVATVSPTRLMVAFGTGSIFRAGDGSDNQIQTIYGITDTAGSAAADVVRADLLEQRIETQATEDFGGETYTVRVLSNEAIDFDIHDGWFIDLDQETGERVISEPSRRADRIRVSTLLPNPDDDPCEPSCGGFFMDFDLRSGGRTDVVVFDLDRDDQFNDSDRYNDDTVSGIDFGSGERITPIRDPSKGMDILVDGSGDERRGLSDGLAGRQSWQQLR